MSSRSGLAVTLAVAAACLVVVQDSPIQAQVRQFPQQGQRNLPQLDLQGTVDAVAVGALKVTSDTKQTWLLRVSGETRVEVKGKASADLLGPGTYIAFTAEVNKKGARIEEKVKQVAIFTPSNRMQVGAVPEGAGLAGGMAGLNVGDDQPFGGGAGAGGKASGKGKPAGKAKSSGKAAAKTSETYEIKGQITSIKGSKVTLKVPNEYFKSSLRFDLAEDVEVSLDIEGTLANCGPLPSLVKQGDRVEIKGLQVAENGGNVSDLKVNLGGTEAAGGEETPKKGKAGAAKDGKDAKDAKGRKAAAKDDTSSDDDGSKKKTAAKKKAKDEE